MSSQNPRLTLKDLLRVLREYLVGIVRHRGGDMVLGHLDGTGTIYVLGHKATSKGVSWNRVCSICDRFGIKEDDFKEKRKTVLKK